MIFDLLLLFKIQYYFQKIISGLEERTKYYTVPDTTTDFLNQLNEVYSTNQYEILANNMNFGLYFALFGLFLINQMKSQKSKRFQI